MVICHGLFEQVALVEDAAATLVAHTTTQRTPIGVVVNLLLPYGNIFGQSVGPAEYVAPHHQIGDEVYLAILVAPSAGESCGVDALGQRVQLADVGHGALATHLHLRKEVPHGHRGVVVELIDHLGELLFAVLAEGLGVEETLAVDGGRAYEGKVVDDQQTQVVADVVEAGVVSAAHDANGVGTHLDGYGQIFLDVACINGIATQGTVAVEQYATHGVGLSVEHNTLVANGYGAKTIGGAHFVFHLVAGRECGGEGIHCGVGGAVP